MCIRDSVRSDQTGNIQYIDIEKLDHLSRDRDLDLYVVSLPGDFVSVTLLFYSTDTAIAA